MLTLICVQRTEAQLLNGSNYDSLIRRYEMGYKDYTVMPILAAAARDLRQPELAARIAEDYIDNYLSVSDSFFTVKNIEFVQDFNVVAANKGFWLYYRNSARINRIMNVPGFSESYIDYIISKEDVDPVLIGNLTDSSFKLDWDKLNENITTKYQRKYADRVILDAKVRWYGYKKDTAALVRCVSDKMNRYGVDTAGIQRLVSNNLIYYVIFMHCSDRAVLRKAAEWMKVVMAGQKQQNPEFIDTYANLLYKVGDIRLALVAEERALQYSSGDKGIRENYDRMKKGLKTWTP